MDADEKNTVRIIPSEAVDNILPSGGKKLHRKRLIDIINYINFQNGTILVNLRHKNYGYSRCLPAYPQSCADSNFRCMWVSPLEFSDISGSFVFVNFIIDKGVRLIQVEGEMLSMDEKGIVINLPEHCCEFMSRKIERYCCKDISAELMQNGVLFRGRLIEFSCLYFAAEFTAEPPQTLQWIVSDLSVYVVIRKKTEVIYSGECSIIRLSAGKEKGSLYWNLPEAKSPDSHEHPLRKQVWQYRLRRVSYFNILSVGRRSAVTLPTSGYLRLQWKNIFKPPACSRDW